MENMSEQITIDEQLPEIKVQWKDGKLITTSLNVAYIFEKRHVDVKRAIRNAKMSNDFRVRNFALVDFGDSNGDTHNKYEMTRDGWSLIVMGFTGEKAIKFKEAFIEAFNKMEKEISIRNPPLLPDFTNPVAAARAWADAKEAELKANQKLIEAKPKIEFYDKVGDCKGIHTVAEAAKMLGTGRNRLFSWMRLYKILRANNEPYQKHIEAGYFEVKESPENGHVNTQTFVTPSGLQWLQKLRRKNLEQITEWAKQNNIAV